jgi:hypothetical protein
MISQNNDFNSINKVNFSPKIHKLSEIPSKEVANKAFWGLGDNFWKQIIDGDCHKFGPLVFDQGLHGRYSEKGYFDSLKVGCEFASEHLTEKPDISFYKDLHKKLCSHFKGTENSTEMKAEETGQFRKAGVFTWHSLKHNESDYTKKQYEIVELYTQYKTAVETQEYFSRDKPEEFEKFMQTMDKRPEVIKLKNEYPAAKKHVESLETQWNEKKAILNQYIESRCEKLSIPILFTLDYHLPKIQLIYKNLTSNEVEQIAQVLFDNYNNSIDGINSKLKNCKTEEDFEKLLDEKIDVIADLYQMLEWLHPFPDGQGRTDLVLLAKLLSEQGLNPAILERPYFSTWAPISEWKDYLSNGIKLWQEERSRM